MWLGIGILWLFLVLTLIGVVLYGGLEHLSIYTLSLILFIGLLFLGIPSWIIFIIVATKWNSEEEKSLKKRAKVNINIKGKMKDLK